MDQFVGVSNWTREVSARIEQVARYTSSVLITGPSGTGKELIARSLHSHSPRADRPFVPVDCASIPGSLFASQLFGHVRGAFTGAATAALGCFRAADGGTIFFDEVGELDLELQSKLLRVIQERQVTPLGSHRSEPIDVRVISATNRDLRKEVSAGRFRLDLYYRLDVVSLDSAPLRDRPEDLEPLAEHFLQRMVSEREMPQKRLSPAAMRMMQAYDWPGNVRQLQNVLERAVVLCDSIVIGPEWIPRIDDTALPEPVAEEVGDGSGNGFHAEGDRAEGGPLHLRPAAKNGWPTMAENDREHLRRTLELTHYNQSAAARLLEIDYRLLLRRMKKYRLKPGKSGVSSDKPGPPRGEAAPP